MDFLIRRYTKKKEDRVNLTFRIKSTGVASLFRSILSISVRARDVYRGAGDSTVECALPKLRLRESWGWKAYKTRQEIHNSGEVGFCILLVEIYTVCVS